MKYRAEREVDMCVNIFDEDDNIIHSVRIKRYGEHYMEMIANEIVDVLNRVSQETAKND